MLRILELVAWVLVGALIMARPSAPTKLEYGLVWAMLILYIVRGFLK